MRTVKQLIEEPICKLTKDELQSLNDSGYFNYLREILAVPPQSQPQLPATAVTWGNISGSIMSQTDLQSSLNAKQDVGTLNETIEDVIGTSILAGSNIAVSYNDTTGKTTIAYTAGGGGGVGAILRLDKNSPQSFPQNVTTTVSWDTIITDTGGIVPSAPATSVSIPLGQIWLLTSYVNLDIPTGTEEIIVTMQGTSGIISQDQFGVDGGSPISGIDRKSFHVQGVANGGETVTIDVSKKWGGSSTTGFFQSSFWGLRIL